MKTPYQTAVLALEVYLKRGLLAIEALENNDEQRFSDLMQWRRAAFENFRLAFEHLPEQDMALDQGHFDQLWPEIAQTNDKLEKLITQHYHHLILEHQQSRKSYHAITKFHSGSEFSSTISQHI